MTAASTPRRATAWSATSSPPSHAERLTGTIGIGHTRYPTIGGGRGEDAQPFQVNSPFGIIMAHNGNVVNYAELKKLLFEKYHRLLNSDNDVETHPQRLRPGDRPTRRPASSSPEHIFKAVAGVYKKVDRQLLGGGLHRRAGTGRLPRSLRNQAPRLRGAARRHRPVLRRRLGERLAQHHELRRDQGHRPRRGRFSSTGIATSTSSGSPAARIRPASSSGSISPGPDSFIDEVNVYRCRVNLGKLLAEEIRKRGPPDRRRRPGPRLGPGRGHRDRPEAQPEIPRSPGQEPLHRPDVHHAGRRASGKTSVRTKLNPIASEFKDKDVLLVDDSIVRGNTSRAIIEMVRECGAKHVYFASYSPPLRYPVRLRHRHADPDGVRRPRTPTRPRSPRRSGRTRSSTRRSIT